MDALKIQAEKEQERLEEMHLAAIMASETQAAEADA